MILSAPVRWGCLILASRALSVKAVAVAEESTSPSETPPGTWADAPFADATDAALLAAEYRVMETPFPGLRRTTAPDTQTRSPATNETDSRSRPDRPMPLNLLYTHGSMRIDDYNQSATTVDPRQLRLALEDMLVEAGKPAAGQTETYFRLDAQNLTLVFHPDPSRQATGDVPGFVWGHVVRAIQVFSKDVRERPDFGRSYVGRVQDAQSKVLASIAIMPAFIQLPGHEPSGQAEEGAPKEQQVEDPDGGGVGRRPLMFAGRQVAAATGWMRVVNTGFWMSWAERSGRLAHYHIVREVIRTADQFVSYTPSDYIYNLRAHWSDIVLAIDCREGLARATARAFLDALARLLDSLMRRRLAEMNRAGDFPLQAMVIMEAVSGMVLRRGTAVAYWSIQFLGPRGRVGPNFVRGRNEL